jgi:hypothetical protein
MNKEIDHKEISKDILHYLSLVSILLIVTGYYDRFSYYKFLDIDIHDLLEPTELIFSFANLLDDFITMLIYGISLNFVWNRLFKKGVKSKVVALFFVFAIGMMNIAITMVNIKVFDFGVSQMTILITFASLGLLLIKSVDMIKGRFIELDAAKTKLFICLISLVTFISVKNEVLASRIVYGHSKYKVSLDHDLPNIPKSTSDTIIYAGSTKNFHFLINMYSNERFVIPAGQVKAIIVKSDSK